jgi:hypothetical protein
MFGWRNALILGLIFIVIGSLYWYLNGTTTTIDKAGATFLIVLGLAMGFTFAVLLRGSREL